MSILIHYELDRRFERAVFVDNRDIGRRGWINPACQIEEATGVWPSRHSCIVSFAHGLWVAGYDVKFCQPTIGGALVQHNFIPPEKVVLVYYLFGRAWAQFQWECLKLSLQQFVLPQMRFAAMEKTAQYYWDHPWERELFLIV